MLLSIEMHNISTDLDWWDNLMQELKNEDGQIQFALLCFSHVVSIKD